LFCFVVVIDALLHPTSPLSPMLLLSPLPTTTVASTSVAPPITDAMT